MNNNKFEFTKSLSITHIVTTIALVIAGFTFIYDLREEIAILEFKVDTVEKRLGRIVERTDTQFDQIILHLNRIEERLDVIHAWNND